MNYFLGIMLFWNGLGMAKDLEIAESIFALGASVGEANSNFDRNCQEWKNSLTSTLGSKALYLSCGPKKNFTLETKILTHTSCSTTTGLNGETVVECTDHYRPAGIYGYMANSESKLLLTISGMANHIEEEISGELEQCKVAEIAPCMTARTQARADFDKICTAFKDNAAKAFGPRLIYASCGVPGNSKGTESGNTFLYESTGLIIYE